jgi:hypothetical protein
LSPTIAGILADAFGLKSTFVFSASVVSLGALILAMTRLPSRKVRMS